VILSHEGNYLYHLIQLEALPQGVFISPYNLYMYILFENRNLTLSLTIKRLILKHIYKILSIAIRRKEHNAMKHCEKSEILTNLTSG
jgi:hypothetical protein